MSNPVASVEIQAKSTGLAAQLREARAKFGAFADGVDREMGKAFRRKKGFDINKRAGSFFGGAAQHALGNLASRGIQSVTDVAVQGAKDVFSYNDRIVRLKIAAQQTPEAMAALSKSVRQVSDATGVSKDKVLSGAEAYVRLTGDMGTARKETAVFAKVAQATNSQVSDIAETAAAMAQNMKVPADQFEEMFSAMSIQGKAGAIELKDLSAELSTIAPQWAQFGGGTGAKGVRELGAALQVVKHGFGGDAGETVTGLQDFLTAVTKKSGRFKAAGVASFFDVGPNGTKTLKSVYQIIDQIGASKIARQPELLTKAFGSVEAYRAYIQLRDNRAELDKLVDASKDAKSIERDFNEYMASSGGKVAQTWEQMKNQIAEAFTPERIKAFSDALVGVSKIMAKIVGFVGDVVDKAEDLIERVNGPSVEKRSAKLEKTLEKGFHQNIGGYGTVEELRATGVPESYVSAQRQNAIEGLRSQKQAQLQDAANLETKPGGYSEEDEVVINASRKYAEFLQSKIDELDQWRMGGSSADKEQMDFAAQHPAAWKEGARGAVVDVSKQLLDEMRKMTSLLAQGTDVKIGADPVAKAAKNAPSNRAKVAR